MQDIFMITFNKINIGDLYIATQTHMFFKHVDDAIVWQRSIKILTLDVNLPKVLNHKFQTIQDKLFYCKNDASWHVMEGEIVTIIKKEKIERELFLKVIRRNEMGWEVGWEGNLEKIL